LPKDSKVLTLYIGLCGLPPFSSVKLLFKASIPSGENANFSGGFSLSAFSV